MNNKKWELIFTLMLIANKISSKVNQFSLVKLFILPTKECYTIINNSNNEIKF